MKIVTATKDCILTIHRFKNGQPNKYYYLINLILTRNYHNTKPLNNDKENKSQTNNDDSSKKSTSNQGYIGDKFYNIYSYGASYLNVISLKNVMNELASISYSKLLNDYKKYEMPINLKEIQNIITNFSLNDMKKSSSKNPDSKTLINLKEKSSSDNNEQSGKKVAISLINKFNQTQLNYEEKIFVLCDSIERASSLLVKSQLIAELFQHLYDNPNIRHAINRKNKKFVCHLLQLKKIKLVRQDKRLFGNINECLSMLGHVDPSSVKYRGVNILSLDGGGTKGFVTIEVLKNIQKLCGGKPIHEIFDYISGVSTGSVLAVLLGKN
jgi:hypothetical protein